MITNTNHQVIMSITVDHNRAIQIGNLEIKVIIQILDIRTRVSQIGDHKIRGIRTGAHIEVEVVSTIEKREDVTIVTKLAIFRDHVLRK